MARHKNRLLSKSRFISGLQCPRYLWVLANDPARVPEPDAGTQYVFDQGHEVGNLAKKLYPGGIDIPSDDFVANLRMSRELLSLRRPLFEAAFMSDGKYARVDILEPVGEDMWNLIEVKSSTSVKDVHYPDVAFQKHCCEQAGLTIDRCFLAHINNEYVRNGDIVPEELFELVDITDDVDELSGVVLLQSEEMLSMMVGSTCPEGLVGPHCTDPYDCPLQGECWSFLPEDSVFTLYRIGRKAYSLLEAGVMSIAELAAVGQLTREQEIQRACLADGIPHVEPMAIQSFLRSLRYPVHYLDFETIGTAIPLYDGVRPYQQVPFMFTVQVVQSPGAAPVPHTFLADPRNDPRPGLVAALRAAIGEEGSIVSYNAPFELGVLRDLAIALPESRGWVESICTRMVDLLIPFRRLNYYHPLQRGSASLKRVLPALTEESYDGLAIPDGTMAGIAYLSTLSDLPDADVNQIRADLIEYCSLDTRGMARVVERLTELSQAT